VADVHPERAGAAIDGPALTQALAAAADALATHAGALNAINVFPVPDGDTGTNMASTMRAAVESIGDSDCGAGAVARDAARGALIGAKGNSGVILSQVLRGLSKAAGAGDELDAARLAEGLERGRQAAYHAVSAPREGTILTAIAAGAEAAAHLARQDADARDVLEAAARAAREAAERTPELMPLLREVGVIDAGALGLALMLDAMARSLRGETPAREGGAFGAIDAAWLAARRAAHAGESSGYCTEFFLRDEGVDTDVLRREMDALGASVVIAAGEDGARVHVHAADPDAVIAHARTLGVVTGERVEALAVPSEAAPADVAAIAVVAVAAGPGLAALFESLGATVVPGGPTMNPRAGDIRRGIERTGARHVIVLPNDANVVAAARQAGEGMAVTVDVLSTSNTPEGVAALVAFSPDLTAQENAAAMREASAAVRQAAVTHAARAATIGGVTVRAGQPMGLVGGRLTHGGDVVEAVARACVASLLAQGGGTLVTLYAGEAVGDEAAEALAATLRAEHGLEVQVVMGGQPHYPYLIGVE
jgi:DAK2 domain fusion protein YloV